MADLNADYWNQRYLEDNFPWDLGKASRPLITYMESFPNKDAKILIPGGGNGYEAVSLFKMGFKNVTILDWSPQVIKKFQDAHPGFPKSQAICADFFEHQDNYDLILEQTFFCALDPALREKYARHMLSLLRPGGKLTGVLFQFPLKKEGPPFGGHSEQYLSLFSEFFEVLTLEDCHNSEPDRQGKELFIELTPI